MKNQIVSIPKWQAAVLVWNATFRQPQAQWVTIEDCRKAATPAWAEDTIYGCTR